MTIVKKQKKRKEGTYIASLHASKKYKNPSSSAYKISSNSILKIKRETRGIFFATNSIQSSLYLGPCIFYSITHYRNTSLSYFSSKS